jgi:ribose transport system substrate-binding protein
MKNKTVSHGLRRLRARRLVLASVSVAVAGGTAAAFAAGVVAWPTASQEIAKAGSANLPFCGTKQITLGIADAYGSNGWSASSRALIRSEAAKCKNVKQIITIGNGDLQKSLSDISSLVSQGANAIAVIPSMGPAELPAIKDATAAGVKVVLWAAPVGGTVGTDYEAYIDWNSAYAAQQKAKWIAKALHGQGNVVFLGVPAGNPVSLGEAQGFAQVFAKYPKIKLLTGKNSFAVTNWDPALAQKTMTALLAKYPKIDGVLMEDGQGAVSAIRAFKTAGRPLVPIATLEANALGCAYKQYKPGNPGLQVATTSARNWLGRLAARRAIAAAQGLPNKEPSMFNLGLYEDSLAGKGPKCDTRYGPDAFLSNQISPAALKQWSK